MATEPVHAGEFLLSESNGSRSREEVVITGGSYPAGQVMMLDAGKYKKATAAGTGAVAILHAPVDASAADAPGVIYARDIEANANFLTYGDSATEAQKVVANTKLAEAGIIVR